MMLTHSTQSADNRPRGWTVLRAFTLIEVIGVVSIIALITAVAAPVIVKRIDSAARDAESTSLKTISDAYLRSSLEARRLPAVANIPQVTAAYLNEHTNNVRVNKRKLNRVFLVHPNFNVNGAGLPYIQGPAGASNPPIDVRLMMISSLAKPLPMINAASFNDIWTTPEGTVPASMSAWGGRGDDLVIERIELAPKFHKVVLVNVDSAPSIGQYAVDAVGINTIVTLAPQSRFAAYYLDGTVFSFYRTNAGALNLEFPETIHQDVSFVYQNGRWGRQLDVGGTDDGTFGQLVDRFLMQPVPCDPASGATQRSVVDAFYDYLWGYADWAFGNPTAVPPVPPFSGADTASSPQYPAYSVVRTAQVHLSGSQQSFSDNLIK